MVFKNTDRPVDSTSIFHVGPSQCLGVGAGEGVVVAPSPKAFTNKNLFLSKKVWGESSSTCWLWAWTCELFFFKRGNKVKLMRGGAGAAGWSPSQSIWGHYRLTFTVRNPSEAGGICMIFRWIVFAASPVLWHCWGTLQGRPWSTAIFEMQHLSLC